MEAARGRGFQLGPASNGTFPHTATLKDDSMVLIRRAEPEDFQMLL